MSERSGGLAGNTRISLRTSPSLTVLHAHKRHRALGWPSLVAVNSSIGRKHTPLCQRLSRRETARTLRNAPACRAQLLQERQNSSEEAGTSGSRYSMSVKDLSGVAEQCTTAGDRAPSVQDIAQAVSSSAESGLSESASQLAEREQVFGSNRLPGRKEVGRCVNSEGLQLSSSVAGRWRLQTTHWTATIGKHLLFYHCRYRCWSWWAPL